MALVQSILAVNTLCNSRCITCDFWQKGSRQLQLSREEIFAAVDQLHAAGVDQVMISGGEPLTHPDITDILRYIADRGIFIILNTNGILLQKYMHEIARYTGILTISMDASTPELYEKIRGVDKFDRIMTAIKKMRAEYPDFRISLRFTIQRYNLFDVFAVASLAESLGCDLGLNPIDAFSDNFFREERPGGSGGGSDLVNSDDLVPTEEELDRFITFLDQQECLRDASKRALTATWTKEKFIRLAHYFRRLRRGELVRLESPPCIVPYTCVLVEANGDVRHCFYAEPSGSIREERLIDLLSPEEIDKGVEALRLSGKCHDCRCRLFC